ncbi:MAG: GNAT family N-acetyltransferase [Chloroflexota bacterium]
MPIIFKNLTKELAPKVDNLSSLCFPGMPNDERYLEEDLVIMAELFPEGSIVAINEFNQNVVGFGAGIFIDLDWRKLPDTEEELLGDNGLANHNPNGKFYFGAEFCVHPDYRGQGIGRKIYDHRKEIVVRNNKFGFFAASVLQGYVNYKKNLDIETYFEKVESGEVYDQTLSMQLRNNFQIVKPIQYFLNHPPSDHWTAFIYWGNPVLGTTDFNNL